MDEWGFDRELSVLASRVAKRLGDSAAASSALKLVRERAPDERLALAFLLKLVEQSATPLRAVLAGPARAADLVFCLGASELVATGLCAIDPLAWPEFFESARTSTADALIETLRFDLHEAADWQEAARALTTLKHRALLQIAIGDLLGRFSVVDTMRAMSRLADECIRAALAAATQILGERAQAADRFCVLAMGKLGAEELNLSSDIDLMYLFDGPDDHEHQEAARRLGEVFTEILAPECFRTDLRLRPGGRNSPLVVSLEGALSFYQSMGQTWERAALLRARPIAGVVEISRFIYRSYLDFDTLRQLRAMKRQVEEELRSPELVERNVKLGRGGIRELEFIVQSLT